MLRDNFEHLVDSAPLLGELLTHCPELKLLGTSRAALHLSAEREYPLEPLPLEHAIVLFTERAHAVRPDFVADGVVLAAICARLDCLPLALELAAARSRVLSPGESLRRLEHRRVAEHDQGNVPPSTRWNANSTTFAPHSPGARSPIPSPSRPTTAPVATWTAPAPATAALSAPRQAR
jgi:hypothetical protein